MKVTPSELDGVLLVAPEVFEDYRGEYVELYDKELFREHGIAVEFVQDDISVSSRGVLRGIHGDRETWKLITCLLGRIYAVVVNGIEGSPHFGRWQSFTLSERNRFQVLVPPGHGVAHLAMSDKIIFHYKQSTSYHPERQFTYRWDDPRFGIRWPIADPILSRRDRDAPLTGRADAAEGTPDPRHV